MILTFWFIFLLGINYLLLQVLLYNKFFTSSGLRYYRFLRKTCEIFYIFSKLYLGLFQWAPERVNIKRPSSSLPRGFLYYKTVFHYLWLCTMTWWMWSRMSLWWLCPAIILIQSFILCDSNTCSKNVDCINGICKSGQCDCVGNYWWGDFCQHCRERWELFVLIVTRMNEGYFYNFH